MEKISDKFSSSMSIIAGILFLAAVIIIVWSFFDMTPFISGAGYVSRIISYIVVVIAIVFAIAKYSNY